MLRFGIVPFEGMTDITHKVVGHDRPQQTPDHDKQHHEDDSDSDFSNWKGLAETNDSMLLIKVGQNTLVTAAA